MQALVQRTEALLAQLAGATVAGDPAAAAQRHQATAAHGRLQGAMQKAKDGVHEELAQVRQGRKVLHGYAQARAGLGQRLESLT